jgi:hypothetical protein
VIFIIEGAIPFSRTAYCNAGPFHKFGVEPGWYRVLIGCIVEI